MITTKEELESLKSEISSIMVDKTKRFYILFFKDGRNSEGRIEINIPLSDIIVFANENNITVKENIDFIIVQN